jgi:hypothetical protein
LKKFLDSYGLRKKIIAYVKGANLNFMTTSFKFVVNCEVLGLEKNFNDTCFGHAFSKTYVTVEERVCKNLMFVSIKSAQFDIHKCITWPKKSRKGRQKWMKVCIDFGI